jgi:hypothetical protein
MSVRRRVGLGVTSGLAVVLVGLLGLVGGTWAAAAAVAPLTAASASAGTQVGVRVLPAVTPTGTPTVPPTGTPTSTPAPPTTAPAGPPSGPQALPTTGAPLRLLLVEVLAGLGAITVGVILIRLVSRRPRRPGA